MQTETKRTKTTSENKYAKRFLKMSALSHTSVAAEKHLAHEKLLGRKSS
jgi:hypothetical protein